jgi:hypothetical protein
VFGLDWTTDPAGRNGTVGITATVDAGTAQVSLAVDDDYRDRLEAKLAQRASAVPSCRPAPSSPAMSW